MRRVGIAALLVAGGGAGAAAGAPTAIGWALAGEGVEAARIGWCAEGMCLTGLTRGEATAAGVVLRWDRAVRAVDVSVPLATVMAAGKGAGEGAGETGGGGGGSWAATLLTRVDVENVVIVGAPVPPLSGQVWPTRALTGEGVTVEGSTVRATVPTEYGSLDLAASPGEGGIVLEVGCAACRLPAPSEADTDLVLPPVRATGTWADGALTGTVRIGTVEAGIVARPTAGADGAAPAGGTATVTLPETPIADVYAVFASIVPELGRARIGGTVRAEADVAWPFALTRLDPHIADFTVDGLVPDGLAGGTFSFRAVNAAGDEGLVTTGEGTSGWVSLATVGPWLPAAVIAAEDAAFREHPGYSVEGMRDAAAKNAEEGAVVRGGSTLTQQLAKNLFLDGTRSYARKLRELLYAVELERELGKRRILEVYLNVVEFGPGLRGARAAAQTYFLKEPAGLLPEEAAWLASILRFPRTAWRTQYLTDRPDDRRVDWILENLRGVPEEARLAAVGRPVRLVPPP